MFRHRHQILIDLMASEACDACCGASLDPGAVERLSERLDAAEDPRFDGRGAAVAAAGRRGDVAAADVRR